MTFNLKVVVSDNVSDEEMEKIIEAIEDVDWASILRSNLVGALKGKILEVVRS